MRSLFFKIFIIFWIAQSLIFVISTALILNRRIPRPVFLSPIFEDLRTDSVNAVSAFESNGCSGLTVSPGLTETSMIGTSLNSPISGTRTSATLFVGVERSSYDCQFIAARHPLTKQ